MPFAPTYELLVLARFAGGMFAGTMVVSQSYIARNADPADKVRFMAICTSMRSDCRNGFGCFLLPFPPPLLRALLPPLLLLLLSSASSSMTSFKMWFVQARSQMMTLGVESSMRRRRLKLPAVCRGTLTRPYLRQARSASTHSTRFSPMMPMCGR